MKSSLDALRASDCQMQFRFDVDSRPNRKRDSFYGCALFPATLVLKTFMLLFKTKLRRATMCAVLKSTIVGLAMTSYDATKKQAAS